MDLLWTAQYGIAPALSMALLHSLWQGALLALLASLVMAACARRSAALRHAIGMGFLLAMSSSMARCTRVSAEPEKARRIRSCSNEPCTTGSASTAA